MEDVEGKAVSTLQDEDYDIVSAEKKEGEQLLKHSMKYLL